MGAHYNLRMLKHQSIYVSGAKVFSGEDEEVQWPYRKNKDCQQVSM